VKHSMLILLCFSPAIAFAQTPRINVARPAYAYELLIAVPSGMANQNDRANVTTFLSEKKKARTDFVVAAEGACPAFLHGGLTAVQFAAELDSAVDKMNLAIALAYEQMLGRLSVGGISAVRAAIDAATMKDSAETRAVDIVATAPGAAESSFKELCSSN
jgi:hypothetical protein